MKLFKKSTMSLALTAAMAGGALMGLSAPAQAVDIAYDGLGQVMNFPYYTTRAGWNTYFNITNTSDKTVAVKVRWREGANSRDVRDFNVIMSPHDVWTAATVDGADGAKMVTNDSTCTVPQLPSVGGSLHGVPFTNTAYIQKGVQDNRDKGATDLDRTREGYFEVIEMGVLKDEASAIGLWAKHNAVGDNAATPNNCQKIDNYFAADLASVQNDFDPPENVLKGRAVLINAEKGLAAGYDPLVLKDFSIAPIVFAPSSPNPSLDSALPGGHAAVDALIMRNGVINDYNVATESQTDWVMTFPTKNFHVDLAYAASANFAAIPFGGVAPTAPFDAPVNGEQFSATQDGKSCFDVNISLWDREEFDAPPEDLSNAFSPAEPGENNQSRMCYEANILSFGESDLFSSKLRKQIPTLPGQYGWAKVTFGAQNAALPVTGMRVEARSKGAAGVNYGFANDHAYTTPQ